MKVKVIKYNGNSEEMDITLNKIYNVTDDSDFPASVKISDDVGHCHALTSDEFEVVEETSTIQSPKVDTLNFTGSLGFTTFKTLQQYASELNIDIAFLPENKVAVYIDNTLDKTYTVETEDELEELVKALRVADKYLDKD